MDEQIVFDKLNQIDNKVEHGLSEVRKEIGEGHKRMDSAFKGINQNSKEIAVIKESQKYPCENVTQHNREKNHHKHQKSNVLMVLLVIGTLAMALAICLGLL